MPATAPRATQPKTALVTGASSGIGEATARRLAAAGFTVYGAARRLDRIQALSSAGVRPLAMDVTDTTSTAAGVDAVLGETGRIDVLVNNAGYGSHGALEDVDIEEARRQFEVNVFGAMALTQLVLPHMRTRRSGKIVNVSSVGGKVHTPLGGWYHGTKFALEGLSDSLRLELKPFGIDVIVVEPGGIATEWGAIAADHLEQTSGHRSAVGADSGSGTKASGGAYAAQATAVPRSLRSEANGNRNSPPSVVADAIATAVTARRPKTRYAVGFGARPLIAARAALSDRIFDALISRATGLPRS